mgnify:FL=1
MKKAIIIVALVAMVLIPVAAKGVEVKGIGVEVGNFSGISVQFAVDQKWTGIASGNMMISDSAFSFGGSIGATYNYGTVKLGKGLNVTKFPHNAGLICGVYFTKGAIAIVPQALAEVAYDFSIDKLDFEAFLRVSGGASVAITDSGVNFGFPVFGAALGLLYKF